jgi:ribose 5-phosphate isomerase B
VNNSDLVDENEPFILFIYMKKILLVCDHAGFELKQEILVWLEKTKRNVVDLTPKLIEGDDYPDRADELAKVLESEPKALGIALCGSGQGIAMALNRYPYIRATIYDKREIVRLSRSHNDANVLCLPARFIHKTKAIALVKVFLNTPFLAEERHLKRIEKLSEKK